MRALFDVNMLLALFDGDHVKHRPAINWHRAHRNDGWATCPITQNGYVRIMSRPTRPQPVRPIDAVLALQAQTASVDHEFWNDSIALTDPEVFDYDRLLGPNQITDAYLLALAVHNHGRLVTLDQAIPIGAVRNADPRHLIVVV